MRKTIYTGKLPTSKKKNKEIFLGFLFSTTTNYTRKKNRKEAGNIFGFSQSFSKTQEDGEKINLAWIVQ